MKGKNKMDKQFRDLNADELETFMNNRGHRYFYHYTTIENLNKILENEIIKLGRADELNDKLEFQNVESRDEIKKYFTTCFSTGTDGNIPLWYLYSGRDGKGVRIRFTENKVKKLVDKDGFKLVHFENNRIKDADTGYQVKFRDILYCHDYYNKNGTLHNSVIRYNNQINYSLTKYEIDN